MLCFLEPPVGQHQPEIRWLEQRPYHRPHVLQAHGTPYLPFHRFHGLHLEDQVITLTHDTVHLRLEFRLPQPGRSEEHFRLPPSAVTNPRTLAAFPCPGQRWSLSPDDLRIA